MTPDRLRSSVGYAAMLLVVTLIAGPLLFVFFTSFKDQPDIYAQPTSWWPLRWYPQNYRTATEQIPFWTFLRNSLIITSVLAVVKFTLGVLSAFGLVFVRFPGRKSAVDDASERHYLADNPRARVALDQLPHTRTQDYARVFLPGGDRIISAGLESIGLRGADVTKTFTNIQKRLQVILDRQIMRKLAGHG